MSKPIVYYPIRPSPHMGVRDPKEGDCYPDGWIGPFDWIERDFGF